MEYNFKDIEQKWQAYWKENKLYKVTEDISKPKFYVLDMFPYPSGAGLHVGHPLGYIASDIFSRYKRLKGFNVLHPMGFDAYGLPAEQYAIQTGQHPAITTNNNINRYKEQLDKIGFSYDWDREVKTCDPAYYHWTQWAFIKMFNHWYNNKTQKAEPIEVLIKEFEINGNRKIQAASNCPVEFSGEDWKKKTEKEKQEILLQYRIAYLAETMVNWCPALGTVLANDEVQDGVSVRGGHPVVQKKMKQWCLRVSAYAQRLFDGLDKIDWSDSLKEIQRNWIGRSEGAEINFRIHNTKLDLKIFTTRPDTIFGVTFMVIAPEHELLEDITPVDFRDKVLEYVNEIKNKTERERLSETKKVTGVFTGAYVEHPFSGQLIPVWVSEYVLSGYGTGAIMAVPAHDQRDYDFAKHFKIPIIQVIDGGDISEQAFDSKDALVINSGLITGMHVKEAMRTIIKAVQDKGIGVGKVNFKIRDAIFSRQRYWGEPFPVYYKDGLPQVLNEDELPLELPEIDAYKPTEKGEPPLGRAKNWQTKDGHPLELSTMPGFAGSSAYYLRYMDPLNSQALVSENANQYWRNVDLYIGGTEHATGHLIYSRFWNKFLYDLGYICEDEPFRKLINQGMIQGRSNFVYRIKNTNVFVSKDRLNDKLTSDELQLAGLKSNNIETTEIHVDVNIVENDLLDLEKFKAWRPEFANATFILNNQQKYLCGWAVEKMSKSMFNVVNPDDIVDKYGADTLRLYEMFLGPIEQSKPWDTNGIDGVHRFLKKLWRLFFNADGQLQLNDEKPNKAELKSLHKTIRKISEDIERFSFNTSVSAFMICVNELTDQKCSKKSILEPLIIILSPFAPHIAEELWHVCGNPESVVKATFPDWNEAFLIEDNIEYPVSFNGKMRFKLSLPSTLSPDEIEKKALADPNTLKWLEGKQPKKVIVVPKKIINIVV